jgi:uncharacterized membrane protein
MRDAGSKRDGSLGGRSRGNGLLALALLGDVVVAFAWLGLAAAATLLPAGSPVRVFAALTTLLVLPGYALTTALFPAAGRHGETGRASLSGVERAALSLGLSLPALVLFGLVTETAAGTYDLRPLLLVLTGFLFVVFAVGVVRRRRTPAEERYEGPLAAWSGTGRSGPGTADGFDLALNVGLVIFVVLSMSMLAVALVAPQDGTHYTEASLLAEQPSGEWAAKNYPTELQAGETAPMMVVVSNEEGTTVEYTVVVELQRIEDGTVTADAELQRFSRRLSPGETWREAHEVTPEMTGDRLRLAYLVYRGTPPTDPSVDSAYRNVSVRVDIDR